MSRSSQALLGSLSSQIPMIDKPEAPYARRGRRAATAVEPCGARRLAFPRRARQRPRLGVAHCVLDVAMTEVPAATRWKALSPTSATAALAFVAPAARLIKPRPSNTIRVTDFFMSS
jgi:hypothetical protein